MHTVTINLLECHPGTEAPSEWQIVVDVLFDGDYYPEYDYFLFANEIVDGQQTKGFFQWGHVQGDQENIFRVDGNNGCHDKKGLMTRDVYAMVRVPPPASPNYYPSEIYYNAPAVFGCDPHGECYNA